MEGDAKGSQKVRRSLAHICIPSKGLIMRYLTIAVAMAIVIQSAVTTASNSASRTDMITVRTIDLQAARTVSDGALQRGSSDRSMDTLALVYLYRYYKRHEPAVLFSGDHSTYVPPDWKNKQAKEISEIPNTLERNVAAEEFLRLQAITAKKTRNTLGCLIAVLGVGGIAAAIAFPPTEVRIREVPTSFGPIKVADFVKGDPEPAGLVGGGILTLLGIITLADHSSKEAMYRSYLKEGRKPKPISFRPLLEMNRKSVIGVRITIPVRL